MRRRLTDVWDGVCGAVALVWSGVVYLASRGDPGPWKAGPGEDDE